MSLEKYYKCPYTEKCSATVGKDCATIVKSQGEQEKGNSGYARSLIVTCQMNHKFDINVEEGKL
jgi:hypothetical protein